MKPTSGPLLLLLLALFVRGDEPKKKPRVLRIGDEVRVHIIGDEARVFHGVAKAEIVTDQTIVLPVLSARADNATDGDVAALNRYREAYKTGDKVGVNQLIQEGLGFRVTEGTRCLVLQRAFEKITDPTYTLIGMPVVPGGTAKVRILEGPAKDSVGWIPVRNLRD